MKIDPRIIARRAMYGPSLNEESEGTKTVSSQKPSRTVDDFLNIEEDVQEDDEED